MKEFDLEGLSEGEDHRAFGAIPIRNVFYLLSYAFDALDEADEHEVGIEGCVAPVDLLARVLDAGVTRLLRRGLSRSFQVHGDEIAGVRGKLDVSTSLKRMTLKVGRAACEFDELSASTLQNQILRATLIRLMRCRELSTSRRDSLWALARRMGDVKEISIEASHFRRATVDRNSRLYAFLLALCRLIHDSMHPDDNGRGETFKDFRGNASLMGAMFEAFVRRFYKRHLSEASVGKRIIEWSAQPMGDASDLDFIPMMETDVSIETPKRTLIVECKFRQSTFERRGNGQLKLKATYVYQLFAYLHNLAVQRKVEPARIEGLILTPFVDMSRTIDIRLHGHRVRQHSLDLREPWETLHSELLRLAK
jgi:5-methylcytosine-specific restriction enzyme subunit McrC